MPTRCCESSPPTEVFTDLTSSFAYAYNVGMKRKVAVLGASGYAGGELVRLVDGHESMEIVHLGAHSSEGSTLADVHPHLGGGDRVLGGLSPEEASRADLVFLALPHGASAEAGRDIAATGTMVVDLGSDYRLDTDHRYLTAYGSPHPFPSDLGAWTYGLPELFDVTTSDRIAAPGCYPTAVLLALTPLLESGIVSNDRVVADCLSGVSGAGRAATSDLTFGAVDEGVRAYGDGTHRHRPEIEMALDSRLGGEHRVVFTPHLVPMQRGILATVTVTSDVSTNHAREVLAEFYAASPCVDVIDGPPQTRWVVGSNRALVTAFADPHTGSLIAQCALDNLMKGAAGQAVQSANLALGFDEIAGLSLAGWMP